MAASRVETRRATLCALPITEPSLEPAAVSELKTFITNKPGLMAAMVAALLFLSTADLVEISPWAAVAQALPGYEQFHSIHDILALGLVLFAAHRWFASLGRALLLLFFVVHIPEFYLGLPGGIAEHLRLSLETAFGFGYMGLIEKLQVTLAGEKERAGFSSHMARHDPLTNLPNRALFHEQAQQAVASAARDNLNMAIIYIDLDHFKDINDSMGHEVGDIVLVKMAERLQESMREGDIVARLGGDEFAIIAKSLARMEDAAFLTERVIERVSQPLTVYGHEINVCPSCGIAPYSSHSDGETVCDAMQLLSHADMAMYRAKSNGRNTFEFYDPMMSLQVTDKLAILNDLRHAIERGQLLLHYQPIVDIRTGEIVAAEALIRWNHPARGMLEPDYFIPPAETSDLITPIGEWVLRTACTQNKTWQDAGLPPFRIAVNLSQVQLRRQRIVELVSNVLSATGLDPKYLDLELTESAITQDTAYSRQALADLQAIGVNLSIDDFGTGYSSLSCLKQFYVDTLKIDQVFVKDIKKGSESAAICEAVIRLGHSLGIKVTAEGVETEAELKYLSMLGCDQAQGYLHSRPVPADDFVEVFKNNHEESTEKSFGLTMEFY